jgi:hypothetical protein
MLSMKGALPVISNDVLAKCRVSLLLPESSTASKATKASAEDLLTTGQASVLLRDLAQGILTHTSA